MADSVTQKLIDDLQGKKHPLSRSGFFSLITFSWASKFIALARAGVFKQAMHPMLTRLERSEVNHLKLQALLNQGKGVFGSVFKTYGCIYMLTILVTILDCGLLGVSMLLVYWLSAEFEADIRQHGRVLNRLDPLQLIGSLVIIAFVRLFINEYANFTRERIGTRIQAGLKASVFAKVLRVSIVNPSKFDEGSITNNLQIDVGKFGDTMWSFNSLFYNLLNFAVTVSIGVFLFHAVFLIMVLALFVCSLVMAGLFKWWYKIGDDWLEAADQRLAYWKNIFTSVRYFKARGFEVNIFEKIANKRRSELNLQALNGVALAVYILLSCICPAVSVYIFLHYFFKAGYELEVSKIAIFIKLLTELSELISDLPWSFQSINDLAVSVARLNRFMKSRETEIDSIRQPIDENSLDSIQVSGLFFWDKKVQEEEDKKKIEEAKKQKKMKAEGGDLSKSLLDTSEDSQQTTGNQTDHEFELLLKDFNVPKSKVTFVIGKIGSGKSSLLHSIVGEMRISKDVPASLRMCGSAAYIGQKPWLLNGTIKENIMLDRPFDSDRMARAVRYAALEDDLKTLGKGLESETGENGDALSGGQKTRVALARCIYQDPDVLLLDDILSALDSQVGAFVMEETILGIWRNKTVLMTTHAIQYLKKGDLIYLMEEGKVVEKGDFEQISKCSIYQRYLEINRDFKNSMEVANTPTTEGKRKPSVEEVKARKASL